MYSVTPYLFQSSPNFNGFNWFLNSWVWNSWVWGGGRVMEYPKDPVSPSRGWKTGGWCLVSHERTGCECFSHLERSCLLFSYGSIWNKYSISKRCGGGIPLFFPPLLHRVPSSSIFPAKAVWNGEDPRESTRISTLLPANRNPAKQPPKLFLMARKEGIIARFTLPLFQDSD